MGRRKLLDRIRQGAVRNVPFADLTGLLTDLGFRLARIRGRHHIYSHPRIPEVLSLQPMDGEAKPYQLRQVVRLLEAYNLLEDADR